MMAFPSILINAAEQVGMKVPDLSSSEDFIDEDFPHFTVFCNIQLCRPIQWGEHWENAKIIAKIPDDKIKTVTLSELLEMGILWQQ